jgi:hypothetical protein
VGTYLVAVGAGITVSAGVAAGAESAGVANPRAIKIAARNRQPIPNALIKTAGEPPGNAGHSRSAERVPSGKLYTKSTQGKNNVDRIYRNPGPREYMLYATILITDKSCCIYQDFRY